MNPTLTKTYSAEAAVPKRRIVKHGTADGQVLLGAAVSDALMGITADIDAAINERVDVIHAGIADVEFGATVTRGDPITADSVGRAVTAAPAAGTNNRIIGFALISGVIGDIGKVHIAPGQIQG